MAAVALFAQWELDRNELGGCVAGQEGGGMVQEVSGHGVDKILGGRGPSLRHVARWGLASFPCQPVTG